MKHTIYGFTMNNQGLEALAALASAAPSSVGTSGQVQGGSDGRDQGLALLQQTKEPRSREENEIALVEFAYMHSFVCYLILEVS